MRDLKRRTALGLLWETVGRILQQGSSWIVYIILLKLLLPSDFGLMAAALILIGLFEYVNELGLGGALVQREKVNPDTLHTLFWLCTGIGLLMTLVIWFSAPYIVPLYYVSQDLPLPLLTLVLQVLGLNMLIIALRVVPLSLLSRQLRFRERATCFVIATMGAGIAAVIVAALGGGVWALVVQSLLQNSLQIILYQSYSRYRPGFSFHWNEEVRGMISYGLKVTGTRILFYFQAVGDMLIAARYFPAASVGHYAVGSQFAISPINKITQVVNPVFFPVFARIQNEQERLQLYFLTVTKYVSLLTFPALVGICLVAQEDILAGLLKPQWGPVAPFLRILSLVGILRALAFVVPTMLNAKGRSGLTLIYSFCAAVVLPIGFFLAKDYGLLGMAKMWFVVYPPIFILLMYFGFREIHLSLLKYVRVLIPAVSGCLFMVPVVLGFQWAAESWGALMVFTGSVVLGAGTYFLSLFWLFRNEFNEVKEVIKALKEGRSLKSASEAAATASTGQ